MAKQKGSSMIEVLVTIVIVSFGLLGIAGLIINSIKSNQSSYARTQASILANDIIDRMRANRTTAESDALPYNLAMPAAGDADNTPQGATIAETDLRQWRAALASTLPEGTGSVALVNGTGQLTVIVRWNNSRVAGGQNTERVFLQTRL